MVNSIFHLFIQIPPGQTEMENRIYGDCKNE